MSDGTDMDGIETLMARLGAYCAITADTFGAHQLLLVLHSPEEQVRLAFLANAGGVAAFMLDAQAHRDALDAIAGADAFEDHSAELTDEPDDDEPLSAENMSGSIGRALRDLAEGHGATEAVVYLAREGDGPRMAWKYDTGKLWAGAGDHGAFNGAFAALMNLDTDAEVIPITPLVRNALGADFPEWIDDGTGEDAEDQWREQLYDIFDAELSDSERQSRLREHLARLDPVERRRRVIEEIEAASPETRREVLERTLDDVASLPGFPEDPMAPTEEEKWIDVPGVDARRVRMTKGAEFLFQLQAKRFRETFGRDMGPEDPVFFDPEADEPRPIDPDRFDTDLYDALDAEDLRADAEAIMEEHGMVKRFGPKPGRNDPCPCGSGLKFKKCHGR